ncbi:MBL fold metallo-hydrolase [Profundibacterium mesophilum]|uniref:Beta-lactamase n=1 Tax=Profundibacterium mesophilum KAUST100406-0324 TaxID=1037889 RepID=A0A921NQF0_9RHOB|nr:MBL fold metallo-hydrolase [Profundibacterium mesophilum]KAF0675287.1 beta-lactamase [Profundibacterium mesophilum KAUST100406-0324]
MHRRHFLTAAPALLGAASAFPAIAGTAASGAMPAKAPALPGAQRFQFGDTIVTTISDGYLHIEPSNLIGIEEDAYGELLKERFRDPETYPSAVNGFLIERGDQKILVDAGAGDFFGPSMGNLPANLAGLGVDPSSITMLLATHLHPDHVGGAVKDGTAAFANAELAVSASERDFWSDESNFSGEMMINFAKSARGVLEAYGDRLNIFEGESEIVSGISALPLHGHTPGHTGYMIGSGTDGLLIWADIVHVPPVQFARPEVGIGFDVSPEEAAKTRAAILDRVASDRLLVAGSHMEFPALANIAREGEGYRAVTAVYDYSA